MKKKITLFSIVFLIVISIIIIVNIKKGNSNDVKVKTTAVEKGNIESFLSTSGEVESKNSKSYFGIQGKVKSINTKVGKEVKKGDILVEYDTPDLNLAVRQAKLQYDNAIYAKEDLINQKQQIDTNIKDLDDKIKELEKIQSPKVEELKTQKESIQTISDQKIKQAENAIELAKISLDSAKNKLNITKSKIVSENNGVVTAINLKDGAIDNGMQPAIEVKDIKNLKIKASVGKYDAKKIKLGQKVIIKNGDKKLNGKISFIDPAAKKIISQSGEETLLNLEIDIIDKSENLKIGFDVDVDILVGQVENVLKIPAECIKSDKKGKNSVYVLKDGKVVEKKVELGLQSDTEVEIKSGLKEKEKVIVNPGINISNGTLAKEE